VGYAAGYWELTTDWRLSASKAVADSEGIAAA
jgi:hypothetical protein